MRKRKQIGIFLVFSAFLVLTTCQLQFNKSAGNNVALRVVVPGGASGGGKGAIGSKSLANGTSLTVTVTPQGTTGGSPQTVSASIGGKASVDFSFGLPSSGTYQVSVQMLDAGGDVLAQNTSQLAVPSGNYPVVLAMYSSLLFNAVLTDSNGIEPLTDSNGNPFGPTTFTTGPQSMYGPPLVLTLTSVDPNATIGLTQDGTVISPSGSVYALLPHTTSSTVTIVVTSEDGRTTTTYTIQWNFS